MRWRAGMDGVEKREILSVPEFELRNLGRPARSQLIYRLHCRHFFFQTVNYIRLTLQMSQFYNISLSAYIPRTLVSSPLFTSLISFLSVFVSGSLHPLLN
jgi:hypothetical protein